MVSNYFENIRVFIISIVFFVGLSAYIFLTEGDAYYEKFFREYFFVAPLLSTLAILALFAEILSMVKGIDIEGDSLIITQYFSRVRKCSFEEIIQVGRIEDVLYLELDKGFLNIFKIIPAHKDDKWLSDFEQTLSTNGIEVKG